jgi:hypothetical protein
MTCAGGEFFATTFKKEFACTSPLFRKTISKFSQKIPRLKFFRHDEAAGYARLEVIWLD